MEIKTKFEVYQTVFSPKDDYMSPKVIQSIEIDVFDFHSNEVGYNILYTVEDELYQKSVVSEDEIVATKEQWTAAKIQDALDELSNLRKTLAELENK